MNIRPYRPSDSDAVARVFTSAVRIGAATHYDEAQRDAWAPSEPDFEYWRTRLDGLKTLVAEVNTSLVGFISYASSGHIQFLFTAPQHVRKGIASALYARAETELMSENVRNLHTDR